MRHLIVGLALATASCAAGGSKPAPEEIAYGIDACDYCHMSVDDGERAAQWIGEDGDVRKFDEPGCLISWLERNPDGAGAAFVADAAGGGWLFAENAVYLRDGVSTGMGFDVLAFADVSLARERSRSVGGEIVGWVSLRRDGVEHAHQE